MPLCTGSRPPGTNGLDDSSAIIEVIRADYLSVRIGSGIDTVHADDNKMLFVREYRERIILLNPHLYIVPAEEGECGFENSLAASFIFIAITPVVNLLQRIKQNGIG